MVMNRRLRSTIAAITLPLFGCQSYPNSQASRVPIITMPLPPVMHFCDVNCTTLRLEGDRYVTIGNNNFVDPGWSDVWEIERFTPESVVLHRTETGRFAFSVVYHGQLSADGNHLVNVTNPFNTSRGQPPQVWLAWGSALGLVPGSNAERDSVRASGITPADALAAAVLLGIAAAALTSGSDASDDDSFQQFQQRRSEEERSEQMQENRIQNLNSYYRNFGHMPNDQ